MKLDKWMTLVLLRPPFVSQAADKQCCFYFTVTIFLGAHFVGIRWSSHHAGQGRLANTNSNFSYWYLLSLNNWCAHAVPWYARHWHWHQMILTYTDHCLKVVMAITLWGTGPLAIINRNWAPLGLDIIMFNAYLPWVLKLYHWNWIC